MISDFKNVLKALAIFFVIPTVWLAYAQYDRISRKDRIVNKNEFCLLWEKTFLQEVTQILMNTNENEFLYCISKNNQGITVLNKQSGKIEKVIELPTEYKNINAEITNNKLYCILDKKTICIYDLISNKFIFIEDNSFLSNFIVYKNSIISYDEKANLSVFSLNDNKIIAERKTNSFSMSDLRYLKIYNDKLLYSTRGFNIYVLSPENLKEIWKYDEGGDRFSARIAIDSDMLFYSNGDELIAFNINTGQQYSKYPLINSDIKIYQHHLYKLLYEQEILKIDSITGKIINKKTLKFSSINFLGDSIYGIDKDSVELFKMDINTFEIIWRSKWESKYIGFNIIDDTNNYLIIQSSNNVTIVSKLTGEILWTFDKYINEENIKYIHDNEILVISDGKNNIYAYDLSK